MKKIALLALGACMFLGTAQAQKQTGGEKNLQVLFAPLGGTPISLNGGGISFRKFNSTGTSAFRVNLFLGLSNTKSVSTQPVDTGTFANGGAVPEGDVKKSSFTIGIRPGYEKHFAGTERLSPYIGAELAFTLVTVKTDSDYVVPNGNNTTTSTGYNVLTGTTKGSGASTTFGLNLIAGFDYYFAKSLSIGAEFGWGFQTTSMPDIEHSTIGQNTTSGAAEIQDQAVKKQGSSMSIGPNVLGQLKLSWLFN